MLSGEEAEKKFYEVMKSQCEQIRPSTREENMFGHIDFICDGVKYDVKAHKKLNRWDKTTSDSVWVEFRNVRGNRGWIKGDADKIAFQQDNEFLIVDRLKLFNWLKDEIKDLSVYSVKQYKKLYQRQGRKDVITLINYSDLTPFIEKRIKIE